MSKFHSRVVQKKKKKDLWKDCYSCLLSLNPAKRFPLLWYLASWKTMPGGTSACSAASPMGCRNFLLTDGHEHCSVFRFPVPYQDETTAVLTPLFSLQLSAGRSPGSSSCFWCPAQGSSPAICAFTSAFGESLLHLGLVCQSKVCCHTLRKHTSQGFSCF